MKLTFAHLVLILLLNSCYKIDRPEKPTPLLSKEKMVAVLVDVALMNSAKSVNKKIIEKNGIVPDEYIYKTHGLDSITFAKSNNFYAYKISDYEEIYGKVKDSLEKLSKKYKAIEVKEKKEKKRKDSIHKAKKTKPNKLLKTKNIERKQMLKKAQDNSH